MLEFSSSGDFSNTDRFLATVGKLDITSILETYGQQGIDALASATPEKTGLTASSWSYEITKSRNTYKIWFTNSHVVSGIPVVILLQYGHGTRTGGYVQGRDFINPAVQPIFDTIAENAWKAVTSA